MEKALDPQLEQALRQAHLIAVYQDMLGRIEGIGNRLHASDRGQGTVIPRPTSAV